MRPVGTETAKQPWPSLKADARPPLSWRSRAAWPAGRGADLRAPCTPRAMMRGAPRTTSCAPPPTTLSVHFREHVHAPQNQGCRTARRQTGPVRPLSLRLFKSEPDSFSWVQQKAKGRRGEPGRAREFPRPQSMQADCWLGDRVFLIILNPIGKEIVGIVEVSARSPTRTPAMQRASGSAWTCAPSPICRSP